MEPNKTSTRRMRFIINGEDCDVDVTEDMTLINVVKKVLKASENTGRPASDYEVRDDQGRLLDETQTVSSISPDVPYFFLTLGIGAGG